MSRTSGLSRSTSRARPGGPSSSGDRLRRRRLAVTGVLLSAALLAVGTALVSRDGSAPSAGVGSRTALAPLEVDPGVVHVHGLGVDPGDGVLYAATHSGLFRLPEQGEPVRVANRAQDTMGFSVVGPGRFIGSGHPDLREDDVRPPLLGLIASQDRGETWDRLSLLGEADFHALQAAHGQVYGYDSTSQTFMVSRDRRQWDRRSRLQLLDFAVSPQTPDAVLATSPQGLLGSTDGGRTWTPIAGAPPLGVLAWAAQDRLYGVASDGTVHVSSDRGTTWQARGSAGGAPEAMTVDARDGQERLYVAATDRGILVSADGGRTFTTRYSE